MSHRRPPGPAGYHWDAADAALDAEGRKTCRLCAGVVPRPRRSFCSSECAAEWKWRLGGMKTVRKIAWSMDRGVCRRCGLDCEKLRSDLDDLFRRLTVEILDRNGMPTHLADGMMPGPVWKVVRGRFRETWKCHMDPDPDGDVRRFAESDVMSRRQLWQADHVHELVDGGSYYDPSNIVSLCIPCHRAKTGAERRRRRGR